MFHWFKKLNMASKITKSLEHLLGPYDKNELALHFCQNRYYLGYLIGVSSASIESSWPELTKDEKNLLRYSSVTALFPKDCETELFRSVEKGLGEKEFIIGMDRGVKIGNFFHGRWDCSNDPQFDVGLSMGKTKFQNTSASEIELAALGLNYIWFRMHLSMDMDIKIKNNSLDPVSRQSNAKYILLMASNLKRLFGDRNGHDLIGLFAILMRESEEIMFLAAKAINNACEKSDELGRASVAFQLQTQLHFCDNEILITPKIQRALNEAEELIQEVTSYSKVVFKKKEAV